MGSTSNKIIVHKDGKNKFIPPEELNDYLSRGYIKGPKKAKKSTKKRKPWSKESREKASKSAEKRPSNRLGKTNSPEHRRKISEGLKGKPTHKWTEDQRKSLSDKFKGLAKSDEHKKKLSEAASKRIGNKNPFYGKHHTDETRLKISISHTKLMADPNYQGSNKNFTSRAERSITKYIRSKGIDVLTQWFLRVGKYYHAYDMYLPKFNLLIEYDGKYWHRNEDYSNDVRATKAKELGYNYLVIKEVDYNKLGNKLIDDIIHEYSQS